MKIKDLMLKRMQEEKEKFNFQRRYICFLSGNVVGALEVGEVLEDGVIDAKGNAIPFDNLMPSAVMTNDLAEQLRSQESGIVLRGPRILRPEGVKLKEV